jgi:hypothetical protein
LVSKFKAIASVRTAVKEHDRCTALRRYSSEATPAPVTYFRQNFRTQAQSRMKGVQSVRPTFTLRRTNELDFEIPNCDHRRNRVCDNPGELHVGVCAEIRVGSEHLRLFFSFSEQNAQGIQHRYTTSRPRIGLRPRNLSKRSNRASSRQQPTPKPISDRWVTVNSLL